VSLVRSVADTSNIIWENSDFRHENPANNRLGYGAARRTLVQSGRTGVVNCWTFSQWKHHHQIQLCLLCNNMLLAVSCVCWPGKAIIRLHKKKHKKEVLRTYISASTSTVSLDVLIQNKIRRWQAHLYDVTLLQSYTLHKF